MRDKFFAVLLLGLVISCAANAQSYVLLTKSGVNVRQEPNTSAPKLMQNGWFDVRTWTWKGDFYWSDKSYDGQGMRAETMEGCVYEVVETVKGWTKVKLGNFGKRSENEAILEGWISSQFLKAVSPVTISELDTQKYKQSGKYKGFSLSMVAPDEGEDGDEMWELSQVIDNKVYVYSTCFFTCNSGMLGAGENTKIIESAMYDEGSNCYILLTDEAHDYAERYGGNYGGPIYFNLNKCTDDEIESIIKSLNKEAKPKSVKIPFNNPNYSGEPWEKYLWCETVLF